ncbi:glycosyltransferase [uncultured Flavobacterium sp.]|uniref:glycosyltransferase n=1 Tax=uncultured Flavobacterium sp. TaxID=165435 RepID=UPI0030ED0A35|tara:strand:- start:64115 stop:65284 length:1170 start_codon:yes stop_codon:yes gene_type:complete
MSKKQIFYIGNFELPDKNAAAHRVINNAKALRELDYEVIFIGIHRDNEKAIKKELFFDFVCYSLPYPNGSKQWIKSLLNINNYLSIINEYNNKHSIILYNMPSFIIYKFKTFVTKNSIKIFSDCTEWNQNSINGNIFLSLFKIFDSNLRMLYLNKKLDGIISISDYLHKYYNSKTNYSIIVPPLVDLSDKKWKIEDVEIKNFIEIVYAGGAFSIKDKYVKDRLDIVVCALSKLKEKNFNFVFKVIGCTKEEFLLFYPMYKDEITNLNENIIFLGKINHLDAIEIIKNASYSIFLRDENKVTKAGFPTKFVESISAGTPVLTNKNSNVFDYLENGVNGFMINAESVDTVVTSLIPALSVSKEKLKEMKSFTYKSQLFYYKNYINIFKKQF